ncbi:MAG TPA: M48 family metallopeptidase [Micromonosporaceae bacterium]|nr:M48 family metallopeptidase [Micromonosporaceae bacterium]
MAASAPTVASTSIGHAPSRPSLIDHVLVHELAHIDHSQHTPAFWATVERAMPDYERRKDDLTVEGARLWLGG